MFCPKCGKQNKEGALYCTECGRALKRRAAMRTGKQSHRGKYLAAAVSLLTVAAAIIVFFIFFSGTPVEGQWYSEDRFSVLEFGSGQIQITDLSGTRLSEYDYSSQSAEGAITVDGKMIPFNVESDGLTLQSPEGSISYSRAKEEINIEGFVKKGLLGLWSNEQRALVLDLKENGGLTVYSIDGEQASDYDYDIEKGEGSITIGKEKSVFSADTEELNIRGSGIFIKQNSGFDTAAFIEKYGNPLKGVWYDAAGVMGRFLFQDGGILSVTSYGAEFQGIYTFSNAKRTGKLSFGSNTMDITISSGVLKINDKAFTKSYVAQKDKNDVYEQLKGTWYDKKGNGTVQFSANGTAVFIRDGNTVNASCTFDPLDCTGEITIHYEDGAKVVNLLLSNGILAAGEWLYTRDTVEQADAITGTWYDADGRVGTLTLKDGGSAELIYAGSTYTGTYTFDNTLGKGTVTTVFNGQTWTFDIELKGEFLVIKTGILFYNEVTFTRESVNQPAASPTS